MTLECFRELGERVLTRWRHQGYNEADLPLIASEEMARVPPHTLCAYEDIISWVFRANPLPYQQYFGSNFGQPPVTLFWDPKFYIEALFWVTSTTAIHDHGFSGAFCVFNGASVHTRFAFDSQKDVTANFKIGQLRVVESCVLNRDDVQAIYSGDSFIHSVFHLDHPNVTLVVRTHTTRPRDQWEYYPPHVAISSNHNLDQGRIRALQALELLLALESPQFAECARLFVESSDLTACFALLQLIETVRLQKPTIYRPVAEYIGQRFGSDADLLLATSRESTRTNHYIAVRSRVRQPTHRFLLALLFVESTAEAIYRRVQERVRDSDARTTVASWMKELAASGVLGAPADDATDAAIDHLLGLDRIMNIGKVATAVEQRCNMLKNSPLLQPLLT